MFYSESESTIRRLTNPVLWSVQNSGILEKSILPMSISKTKNTWITSRRRHILEWVLMWRWLFYSLLHSKENSKSYTRHITLQLHGNALHLVHFSNDGSLLHFRFSKPYHLWVIQFWVSRQTNKFVNLGTTNRQVQYV